MSTITSWEFYTDLLRDPSTGDYVGVHVNDLGSHEWQFRVVDLWTNSTIREGVMIILHDGDHLIAARNAVKGDF